MNVRSKNIVHQAIGSARKHFWVLRTGFFGGALITLQSHAACADVVFANMSSAMPVKQVYDGGWNHFVGGGLAVFDCDGDRLPDVFSAGGTNPARLFVNASVPGGDIAFNLAEFPALTGTIGAYPIDVDSDGHLDLVVLRHGENLLFQGQGECLFEPAPTDWAFDGGGEWTTSFSATFEPGQEWPTLAFGNYVDETNPAGPFETCDKNYLLRPNDRTFARRIPIEPGYCALSMLFSDWQRNGKPDLRISNDRQYYVRDGHEQMWRLDPIKEYSEADAWPELKIWGMGIASRDITGDGLPEIVLTSMGDQQIQINEGNGVMTSAPYSIGTYATTPYMGDDGRPSTGWHAEFGDINNDSRDDIFIAKGNVDQMPSNAIHDPNNLLMQNIDGTFSEIGGLTGLGSMERARGASIVDLNYDGKLDILVINRRAPIEVWQNKTTSTGHWIALDLRQDGYNTRAVGAIVEVHLPDGRILTRENTVGGGHASGTAAAMHFGLGDANTAEIRVIWPGGATSNWAEVGADRTVTILRRSNAAFDIKEE